MHAVWFAVVGAAFLLGVGLLAVLARRGTAGRHQLGSAELADTRSAAEAEAGRRRQAEADAARAREELAAERSAHEARLTRLRDTEARLDGREQALSERIERLRTREGELADERDALATARADLAGERTSLAAARSDLDDQRAQLDAARDAHTAELDAARDAHTAELERIAGLTAAEARTELMAGVEAGARRDAALLVRSIENEARAEGTDRARAIVTDAVQRVAGAQTAESVVSVLHLPAEEMKGRIIGREGRNIRSFEAVTGVNVIIDDTPEAVLLSCFDPVRREIARLTLERLVTDGRIHPHRIEEAYEHSRAEVDELCLRAARDALAEVGVGAVDEHLLPVLGRLKYRTSYGQNVLAHLVETAHVAGVMAAELGVEPRLVKRSAFLHDIGKALTHEVEGSHALVGADLLRTYGEDEAVAHAVEAHHNEVQPRTIEAVLTQAADTCSASRPGARREALETYVKRLARIEQIAAEHEGVDRVFAMQAGREVRVMVEPGQVDDLAASVIAREIAKQIEGELTYPGQIRVTVVRETRSTEIAH